LLVGDDHVPRIVTKFLDYGMELKLENRSETLEGVNWCQTKPVWHSTGWRMTASYRKVLSSASAGVKYWADPGARPNMAFSVGQCLLALYPGTPILQEYAIALCRAGNKLNADITMSDIYFKVRAEHKTMELGSIVPVEILEETRHSFSRAWGVCPSEQRAIEQRLSAWKWGSGTRDVPLEVLPGWVWDYVPGTQPAHI
jgi:hypothetical protein